MLSSSSPTNGVIAFVVGPEGGWSPAETHMFDNLMADDHDSNSAVQAVSLGSTILRSETACMLAVGAFALQADMIRKSSIG